MPNHIGAFLKASRCFSELGVNITRVSYNKAVDSHTLFIDAEGTENQLLKADDAYAGSETFYRMRDKLEEIFGIKHLLPTHQGRAYEHIIAQLFVKPGSCVIMNYHFTASKAHVTRLGGRVEDLVKDEGLVVKSTLPFKGNIDLGKMKACIEKEGAENIAYVRLEAGTNLIGGQPISYANMKEATDLAKANGIPTVLDTSLAGQPILHKNA